MDRESFPPGVAEHLNWYVYRLIDPRNGETFYVGKGRENRIFDHARGALPGTKDEDAIDLKSQRIKDIRTAGLSVGHVVHRHNIESPDVAYQIEAALIDAYQGLANIVTGHHSGDYGCRHVEEIIAEYEAKPFRAEEPLILISIAKTYYEEGRSIYDAVRSAWRIDLKRAKDFKLVLGHRGGVVVGAFRPTEWLLATKANFDRLEEDIPGRAGFVGVPAEEVTARLYIGKRVPDEYRVKGAQSPIRYVLPSTAATPEDAEQV